MRIVSRYLLAQFAAASAAVLAGLFATFLTADALLRVDGLADDPGAALWTSLLRALDVLPLGVPLACAAGAAWSLTRAVRFREVTAIRSSGIPLRGALTPVLVASLLVAGALAFLEDRVVVPARERASDLERGEEGGLRGRPRHLNGRWWYASGNAVFSAAGYDGARQTLRDVSMFALDERSRIRRRVVAREARFEALRTWQFVDARVHEFTDEGVRSRSADSVRIDLGVSGADVARAQPDVAATSLHKLARRIREHRGDATTLAGLRVSFHARLAQPLSVLILVLLAIPFAIGDVERGDSLARALLWSLGGAALYWTAWTLAIALGRSGALPAAALPWGVTLAFLALGAWRFRAIEE